MEQLSLRDLAVPMIKSIDSFNYLLKSHHRRVAIISYFIGKEMNLSDDDLVTLVLAASMHDVGALSVQERNMLIQEDVTNPTPHCEMGYKMLKSFEPFEDIAKIILHHHTRYDEVTVADDIPIQSHIIHLADRVDIYLDTDRFVLDQKDTVLKKIESRVNSVFHPEVFQAFKSASKPDLFWIEIMNLQLDQLFARVDFTIDFDLTLENVMDFAQTMSKIVDFRSKFTVSHSNTVAHLVYYIGGLFQIPLEECIKLMIAGFLHDIGKIGIDPSIVEKKGQLTDGEYNQMKLHSYYTEQILQELSNKTWFKEIVYWAANHHEKTDGSGYPKGFDESKMDNGVKILAYADVITALMENRPYRDSIQVDEAFKIIDEKIADLISRDMFEKLNANRKQIETIVKRAQESSLEEYQKNHTT